MSKRFLFACLNISTLTILVNILGCTTTSINQSPRLVQLLPPADAFLKPESKQPEESPEKQAEQKFIQWHEGILNSQTSQQNEKWLSLYLLGTFYSNRDPLKACEKFRQLQLESQFPLQQVVAIRAFGVCDDNSEPLDQFLKSNNEAWLHASAIQSASRYANLKQDQQQQLDLINEQIDEAPVQQEKIELVSRALELAKLLQKPEMEKSLQMKLKLLAPRFTENPTPSEWLKVAADFRQAREFGQARSYFQKVLDDKNHFDEMEKYKALQGIRMAFKIEKRVDEYVKATHDMAAFTENKVKSKRTRSAWLGTYLESNITLARTIWTEQGSEPAEKVLENLEKVGRGELPLNEVRWLQSRIQEERGDFNAAFKILEKINVGRVSDVDLRTRILWAKAWNLRKAGRLKEALEAMTAHISQESSKGLINRARYWQAKIHLQLDDKASSDKLLTQLTLDDPTGFYGLLAYRDLGLPLPPLGSQQAASTSLQGVVDNQEVLTLEWLIAVNEKDLGARYLDFLAAKHRLAKLKDQDLWKLLLRHYARVGNFRSLFARLQDLPSAQRNEILLTEPDLLFPKPFGANVEAASQKYSVPHELIYAIMRQESSFHTLARSHADAFGLMQLIPESATTAAQNSGVPFSKPEDLYTPEINIPLGAAFLKGLLDRYDQQIILTAASYNASEKAIDGWMKTRFRGNSLEFIEDIPYEETRNYVKLVVRNFIFYRRIQSAKSTIPFPEETLRLTEKYQVPFSSRKVSGN